MLLLLNLKQPLCLFYSSLSHQGLLHTMTKICLWCCFQISCFQLFFSQESIYWECKWIFLVASGDGDSKWIHFRSWNWTSAVLIFWLMPKLHIYSLFDFVLVLDIVFHWRIYPDHCLYNHFLKTLCSQLQRS